MTTLNNVLILKKNSYNSNNCLKTYIVNCFSSTSDSWNQSYSEHLTDFCEVCLWVAVAVVGSKDGNETPEFLSSRVLPGTFQSGFVGQDSSAFPGGLWRPHAMATVTPDSLNPAYSGFPKKSSHSCGAITGPG